MDKILILSCWDDDFELKSVRGTPENAYFCDFLKKNGMAFRYVFPSKRKDFPPEFTPVKARLMPEKRLIRPMTSIFNYFLLNSAILRKVRSLKEKYSLVYSICSSTSLAARKIADEQKIPFAQKFAGLIFYPRFSLLERILKDFHTFMALRLNADRYFVVDDGSGGGKALIKLGIPEEKVVNLPNPGPEIIYPKMQNAVPVVGWIGRFNKLKGVHFLPEIIERVLKTTQNVKFRIIGFGEYEEFLKSRLPADRVSIERGGTYFETLKVYRELDILMSTNIYANLTLPVIEALAHGVPVVAFDVPGTRRIIKDGENGFVVRPFDVEEFAERVIELVKDRELRERMGGPGREAACSLPPWPSRIQFEVSELLKLVPEES